MEGIKTDRKEYLRKYLPSADDRKKKKKKKKLKVGPRTVTIIDDDIDLNIMRPIEAGEFDILNATEDAPQIVGVIDERGPVDFSDRKRWKIIADDGDGDITITSSEKNKRDIEDATALEESNEPEQRQKDDRILSKKSRRGGNDSDEDSTLGKSRSSPLQSNFYPKSKSNNPNDDDFSPPRRNRYRNGSDSDLSPPRESKKPPRKNRERRNDSDSDLSPPRESKRPPKKNRERSNDSDLSPPRESKKPPGKNRERRNDSDSDLSPPRESKNISRKNRDRRNDSNLSPSRSSKYVDDNRKREESRKSPQRKTNHWGRDLSPPRSKGGQPSTSKRYDSDLSPPRKGKKHLRNFEARKNDKYNDADLSPPRRSRNQSRNVDSDAEPSRKSRKTKNNYDSDLSPPRRNKINNERSRSRSDTESVPPRSRKRSESPSKRTKHKKDDAERSKKKSRWDKESETSRDISGASDKRMKKTLDGKTAGLQDAKALRQETEAHKKREAELFQKLSAEVSGVGQATIIRDRKTGRKRDLLAEAAVQHEKDKKHQERVEKYAKWGKGLKQVEDQKEKLERDLYEMTKPLARYADDADLDRELRAQDRDGDPMLAYIKQKQLKEGTRKPDVPKYEGSFMPNRFGIRPGHRWDGVDRSNGYEKKWFEARNARKAVQEEAYKWSTSDM